MEDYTFLLLFLILLPSIILLVHLISKDIRIKKQRKLLEEERIRQQKEIEEKRKELLEQQRQIQEQVIQMITSDFEEIGWSEWDESIHRVNGQFDRLKRATDGSNDIRVIVYNPSNGYAKVKGNSYNYYLVSHRCCSCPDFRKRRLPCKHMYRLATFIAGEDPIDKDDRTTTMPNICEDDLFWGFMFNITGSKQEPVRQLIMKHYGTFKSTLTKETTALIMADNKKTTRVYDAIEQGIEVFSVDEIEHLFENIPIEEAESIINV